MGPSEEAEAIFVLPGPNDAPSDFLRCKRIVSILALKHVAVELG